MPKLSDEQKKVLSTVEEAFRLPTSAQVRYFWRCLRKLLLPDMPGPEKGQSTHEYVLAQLRWQRLAALAQDSHVAAAQLLKDEIALLRQNDGPTQGPTLTPQQAEEQIQQVLENSPRGVQWRVFERLGLQNPGWAERLLGTEVDDEDEK